MKSYSTYPPQRTGARTSVRKVGTWRQHHIKHCFLLITGIVLTMFSFPVHAFIIVKPKTFKGAISVTTQQKTHLYQSQSSTNGNENTSLPQPATTTSPPSAPPSATSLSKLESKAVQRFTISYDKLCKSCPTRIQPRVDTLTEMIMGLNGDDRQELLERVALRMKEQSFSNVASDKDVYKFQTGVDASTTTNGDIPNHDEPAIKDLNKSQTKKDKQAFELSGNNRNNTDNDDNDSIALKKMQQKIKLLNKISKTKSKYNSYKQHLVETRHLLSFITLLLSSSSSSSLTTVQYVEDAQDNAIYHKMDELHLLKRKELKMERLKLMAQKAKLEQKVAKCRVKLYGASLKLVDDNEEEG